MGEHGDEALMPSLLRLSNVMGTGHHAAVVAGVAPGKSAAVVGDGAVGLCGVIAAKRLGADQIIILGHHEDRIGLAKDFGATDVVSERGDAAVERVRELPAGRGAVDELEVTPLRSRRPVAIWVVRDGDDLYIRSWRGRSGSWFRAAQAQGEGRISAGGVEKDVDFVGADDDVNDAVDVAYRA